MNIYLEAVQKWDPHILSTNTCTTTRKVHCNTYTHRTYKETESLLDSRLDLMLLCPQYTLRIAYWCFISFSFSGPTADSSEAIEVPECRVRIRWEWRAGKSNKILSILLPANSPETGTSCENHQLPWHFYLISIKIASQIFSSFAATLGRRSGFGEFENTLLVF